VKNTRNTPLDHPAAVAHQSAPDPTANRAMAIDHAPWCAWRRRCQRSVTTSVNAAATKVALPASAVVRSFTAVTLEANGGGENAHPGGAARGVRAAVSE
jgi:hypothetical protein